MQALMKTCILGTTQGLGQALVPALEKMDFFGQIVELNRPEFDLTKDHQIIIDGSTNFDVFIINAHSGMSSVELLYRLFEKNKDRVCDILIVGSVSADGDRKEVNRYAVEKAAIDKAVAQLQLVESECRVMCIKPGRMETSMTTHRMEYYRMDRHWVAKAIVHMLSIPRPMIMKTLTLDVHNANRKIK